jgi:hypothetical protein
MGKKKIADSIIIRVGGGIREVRRKPLEKEVSERSLAEADFGQAEDMPRFGAEIGSFASIGTDKVSG